MLLLVLQGATVVVRAGGTEGLAVPDLPSTSTFAARLGEGGTDMTSAIPLRQHTTAAERMRLHRERRRQGLRCLIIELRVTEIDVLVRRNFLKAETRNDMYAVRRALYQYLDQTLGATL
jgi:hypothetical protein